MPQGVDSFDIGATVVAVWFVVAFVRWLLRPRRPGELRDWNH
jgi:hypothetical protein